MKYVYTVFETSIAGAKLEMYKYREDVYNALLRRNFTTNDSMDCYTYRGKGWEFYYTYFISDSEKVITEEEADKLMIMQELTK